MAPSLSHAFTLDVDIGPRQSFGETHQGHSGFIPITGGTFSGPRLNGEVLPGGGDWGYMRVDGVFQACARYTIKTEDGTLINVKNDALLRLPPAAIAAVSGNEEKPVQVLADTASAAAFYGRTMPVFEVEKGKYDWLNKSVFLGELIPVSNEKAIIVVYEVL